MPEQDASIAMQSKAMAADLKRLAAELQAKKCEVPQSVPVALDVYEALNSTVGQLSTEKAAYMVVADELLARVQVLEYICREACKIIEDIACTSWNENSSVQYGTFKEVMRLLDSAFGDLTPEQKEQANACPHCGSNS